MQTTGIPFPTFSDAGRAVTVRDSDLQILAEETNTLSQALRPPGLGTISLLETLPFELEKNGPPCQVELPL